MDCGNCAASITNLLKKKGLNDAQVNFATGEAFFTLNDKVDIEEVKSGIEEMGYKVVDDKKEQEAQGFLTPGRKLIISAIFTVPLLLHMLPGTNVLDNPYLQLALSLPVVIIGTLQFGRSALGSLKNMYPNMDVLIFTGFMAAFIYSLIGTFSPQTREHAHHYLFYETAASIITLVLLGNFIEHKAVSKTASSIDELVKLKPVTARIVIKMGASDKYLETDISNVKKGDIVAVLTGERIPVDGIIIEGKGNADQSMFTGESEPVFLEPNRHVIGGSILADGNIKLKVENTGEETYLSKLIELVKKASFNKPAIQRLGDKVSAIFVPVVVAISIATYFISHFVFDIDNFYSVMRAIAVLVISCPCAMGLATPTAVMVGIGRSARSGILIRGGDTMQMLAESKQFLFDKTGTLTTGKFRMRGLEIFSNDYSEPQVKSLIRQLEMHSAHPLAKSVAELLKDHDQNIEDFESIDEIKGVGINAKAGNDEYYLGSERILPADVDPTGANLYLVKNKKLIAALSIEDDVKEGSKELIEYLSTEGISSVILSGDTEEKCKRVAEQTGIQKYYASLLPHQKLELIDEFKKQGYVVMVGDGINDAPSLTSAHAGISFGNASDIAIQSANVIILNNTMSKIAEAHLLGKHTLRTIKQNLFWAFCYNIVAIPLAAMGFLNPMWGAAFMAFSDVMVIGNSVRLGFKKLR